MDLQIVDIKGKDTGKKVKLSKDVFEVEPNDHAIYLDVKQYLAANRQGTHKAKERADISGSTRKIKKQNVLVLLVQVVLSLLYLEVVVVFLVLDQETMILN